MSSFILNDSNVWLFAARHYINPRCTSSAEFESDFSKPRYIRRLFYRYDKHQDLKLRLILNHIIEFYNVFESQAATLILFYKVGKDNWKYLKPFLVYLNYMPEILVGLNGAPIFSESIEVDSLIVQELEAQ